MLHTTLDDRDKLAIAFLGTKGPFEAYFHLYDELAAGGDAVVRVKKGNTVPNLEHTHVLITGDVLKTNPHSTLEDIVKTLREKLPNGLPDRDIWRAVNLAVQLVAMIDSEARNRHAAGYAIGGYQPTSWLPNETYLGFLERVFPPVRSASTSERVRVALEEHTTMKAWKLQKRCGIRFCGTNNLAEHLLYDRRRNCLYLFHHTSFLKAQLEKFRSIAAPLKLTLEDTLSCGALPPQLLVETLHSLQAIIFPSIDERSAKTLNHLTIRSSGFDKDCAEYEGYKIFQEPPETFRYVYWGERLADLHDLLMQKPPRNQLERWFERQSTEGNALLISWLALLISILVGVLSIGLTAFQTWVSWMAWKHPVSVSS